MRIDSVLGMLAAGAALMGVAHATHVEPTKANKVLFALVNAYGDCGTPNTATQTGGIPACAPAVSVGICALGPGGSGKLTIKKIGSAASGTQDLKISAVASGLNVPCEGNQLHVRLSFRLTTDDCPEGSCTTVNFDDLDLDVGAYCVVTNGKCKIEATLSAAAPGLIAMNGKNAGIEVLGCGLKSLGFPIFPADLQCCRFRRS